MLAAQFQTKTFSKLAAVIGSVVGLIFSKTCALTKSCMQKICSAHLFRSKRRRALGTGKVGSSADLSGFPTYQALRHATHFPDSLDPITAALKYGGSSHGVKGVNSSEIVE
jgi:hypothetical protein